MNLIEMTHFTKHQLQTSKQGKARPLADKSMNTGPLWTPAMAEYRPAAEIRIRNMERGPCS